MWNIIGFALLGIVAGTVSGLLGIGGALIMIPVMVFIFGFDQELAQGTSLMLMIPPIGLLAALQYYKAGKTDLLAAGIIATFFFFGGLLGSKIALNIKDPMILRRGFALLMMVAAIRMWFK